MASAQPNDQDLQSPPSPPPIPSWVSVVVLFAVLLLAFTVALWPGVVYAPVPKAVLFTLIAILPAILFGSYAQAKFELSLPGMLFSAAGIGAFFLGVVFVLTLIAKPEHQIAAWEVIDEDGQAVPLDWGGAVDVGVNRFGLPVTLLTKGNHMVVIFPEQVTEIGIRIKKSPNSPAYSGTITYAGTRKSTLKLGHDFTK